MRIVLALSPHRYFPSAVHYFNLRELRCSTDDIPPLFLALTALLVHAAVYYFGLNVAPGHLHDPDSYLRLVRVEQLLERGEWFDQTVHGDNAPFGLTSHWSRPLDLLILILYAPLRLVCSSATALWTAGVWISPLLLLPCLLAIDRVARQWVGFEARLLLCLFFVTQPGLMNYFLAGRPDHHAFILTCALLALTTMVGWMMTPVGTAHRRAAVAMGVWISLGMWTSVETLFMWGVLSLLLALLWLRREVEGQDVAWFHSVLACLALCWLTVEIPFSEWPLVAPDRLGPMHVLLFALIALSWWVLGCVKGGLWRRLLAGLGCSSCSLLIIAGVAPVFLSGPFGSVDPQVKEVWLQHVQELHRLGNSPTGIVMGLLTWVPSFFVGLAGLAFWYRHHSSMRREPLALMVMVVGGLALILCLYQKRWVSYANLAWFAPAALSVAALLAHYEGRSYFRWLRIGVLMAVCALPPLWTGWAEKVDPASNQAEATSAGSIENRTHQAMMTSTFPETEVRAWSLAEGLARWSTTQNSNDIVLAFIDDGSEILYRTSLQVISSPYHRNRDGILDAHRILSSSDRDESLRLLRKRGIRWIAVGHHETERSYYELEGSNEGHSFYKALVEGSGPEGFNRVAGIRVPGAYYSLYETPRTIWFGVSAD